MKVKFKHDGNTYEAYLHKCKRCGRINVILYSTEYFICEYCNHVERLKVEIEKSITDYEPVEKWREIKDELLLRFAFTETE